MCEFVEDGQGLMPGLVCGGGVAIAVVDVSEAGEGHSFEVAVWHTSPFTLTRTAARSRRRRIGCGR
jgi:hypothetical protein